MSRFGQGLAFVSAQMLDRLGKLRPGSCQAELTPNPRRELGAAIPQVLNETMAAGEPTSRRGAFESAHRSKALFQVPVVTLDAIVQVA